MGVLAWTRLEFAKEPKVTSEWRVTRNARPLLRAEERAIVRRMSNENTEVKSFFTRYEAATRYLTWQQPRSECVISHE